MAKLTLSYLDVYQKVAEFLGYVSLGTAPTGTNLTTVKDIVARGLRQFLYPIDGRNGTLHDWSFLRQYFTFTVDANQWKCALPPDFSEMLTPLVYDTQRGYPDVIRRDATQIKQMRSLSEFKSFPEFFAITPSKYDLKLGTLYEVWLYPTPNQKYVLSAFYQIDPLRPEVTTDFMVGGIRATEAILESCLAIAEQQEDDTIGQHTAMAAELIQRLVVADSTVIETDLIGNLHGSRFGYNSFGRYWPRERFLLTNTDISNVYAGD